MIFTALSFYGLFTAYLLYEEVMSVRLYATSIFPWIFHFGFHLVFIKVFFCLFKSNALVIFLGKLLKAY